MGFGQGFGFGYGRGRGLGYGYGRGLGLGHSRGAFSGFSCVKFIFFGFNVIFWLLGCAILGIGIWLQVSKGAYASLAPSYNILSATVLCITAGTLVLIIGFFGCCGAIMENKCMLITYFVLVIVVFILEIVAGVIAFIYRADIEKFLYSELAVGIKTHYPADTEQDTDGLRAAWSYMQATLECCGIYNYTDWYKSSAWPQDNFVPRECCKMNYTNCNTSQDPSMWYRKGCLNELKNYFIRKLYILGIMTIIIGVIQILGLLASMVLFCCLRMDKFYDDD